MKTEDDRGGAASACRSGRSRMLLTEKLNLVRGAAMSVFLGGGQKESNSQSKSM